MFCSRGPSISPAQDQDVPLCSRPASVYSSLDISCLVGIRISLFVPGRRFFDLLGNKMGLFVPGSSFFHLSGNRITLPVPCRVRFRLNHFRCLLSTSTYCGRSAKSCQTFRSRMALHLSETASVCGRSRPFRQTFRNKVSDLPR